MAQAGQVEEYPGQVRLLNASPKLGPSPTYLEASLAQAQPSFHYKGEKRALIVVITVA